MDKKQVTGLTREEKELLDSYNRMIMQNGWLNGSNTADARSKVLAGFKKKLGKVGEGHYYNYMLLVNKSSKARVYEEKGAAETGNEEVSKYFETLEIPDFDDAFNKAQNERSAANEMEQVRGEAEYKTQQLEDAAQVILNWDEKYKKYFAENKEPEIYDETVEKMNEAPLEYDLTTDRTIFTKNPDDMPIYIGFEDDLKNLRYEYFEKDLENAKGIRGVSSSVLGEMDPDKRLKILDGMATYVRDAANEFIKAARSNGVTEKKVKDGKEVVIKKELTMNEERELILKGLDILCHPALRFENAQNSSQVKKADENYALKNEVFTMIRKLTSDRVKDLEMRAADPTIKGPDGVEKAYKFIYDKAGFEGVEYYQWVTSLNSSLDVLVSHNKLDRMEAHVEVGNHYRKALQNYHNDKADVNYKVMTNYDAEINALKKLEEDVAKTEKKYQEEYVGIIEGRKERHGYNEKIAEWNETEIRLNQELADAHKKKAALSKLKSDIKHEIESTKQDISICEKTIDDLSKLAEEEAKKISSSVEDAELKLNTFKDNVSAEFKKMEEGTYEDAIKRINDWTADQGLNLAYELGNAKDYQSLLGVRKTLDEFEKVVGTYKAHQLEYAADAEAYFSVPYKTDLDIEPELLPLSENGCTALGKMVETANVANHMLGKVLIDISKTSRYTDEEVKAEALDDAKHKALYQLGILSKTYSFDNMYTVTGGFTGDNEKAKKDRKEFMDRFNAERDADIKSGLKSYDVATADAPYNYGFYSKKIEEAKDGRELTETLNDLLKYGQAHWKRLDCVYRAQMKEAKLNLDETAAKIKLPKGMTLDKLDVKTLEEKNKDYSIAHKSIDEARNNAEAERNQALKKVKSLKGILDIGFLKSKELKDAEEELENAEEKLMLVNAERIKSEANYGNEGLMLLYANTNERYKALKAQYDRCVHENGLNIKYNSAECIDYLSYSSEQTQKWYEGLKANRENFEKACKQQMIETAQTDYLESLNNIEKTVNSQAQEVMTVVVEDVIKKNEKGETLGEEIHRESVEKAVRKMALEKFEKNLDRVSKALDEATKAYDIALKNRNDTVKANKKEKERLKKLCDDYVNQKALLFNKQGIMKNELPKMCEYFKGANEQYRQLRKLLPLTPAESEKLKQKDVKLEELVNGRPSNEFRESVENKLLGYFTTANMKQFKTSNSDDYTKMVNAIGKAIGKDPVDNSGKFKELKEPDKAKNYFEEGSLSDCRKRLEEIKLAAENYIAAKRDQKWILFPSELRVHRLKNAIFLVNYVENCLDQLTGNKKEYKVEAAPKANDEKKNDNPYGISDAKTEVVDNKKGLLNRHTKLQDNFKKFITIPHTQGNVFEDYQSKMDDLRAGTKVINGVPYKSSNNEMQAFITTGLHRLNSELSTNEAGLEKQSLDKIKVHIYVDTKENNNKIVQNGNKEKGLISSLFSTVKNKVAGIFKS